jgi:hypothetical protein
MRDPGRFLSQAGSFEARLLGSLRTVEPPDSARDAIWRRVEMLTGAAALAGVATVGAQMAAGGGATVERESLAASRAGAR